MNLTAQERDEVERPRGGTLKFTYPSGSRPLDGYTIKRGVGRGGFGEVYFATSDAGKEVALKLIRRNLEVELRGVTQCLNLKHGNLIALYDIRTDDMGDQWVVMEYVSGESLEDAIDRNTSGMPIEEVLWWMRGLCAGVAYLHDHGIVHRDLKPGNIFCDDGTVKIGDYGLAKFISCSRRSGQTESVGTVHYMAPEIANGRYGREIDTYALGIILFEMLTGKVPFEGESVGEVLMKHLTAEPELSVLAEPYRDIVRRALAKDPSVRINSVQELVALLPGGSGATAPTPPLVFTQAKAQSIQPEPEYAFTGQGTVSDANKVARDGWSKAADMIRAANQRAASAIHPEDGSDEEPIWKAIREQVDRDAWTKMPPFGRGILLFGMLALLLWYPEGIFSVFIPLFFVYWIYYAVWSNWLKPSANPRGPAARKGPIAPAPKSRNEPLDQQTMDWMAAERKPAAQAAPVTRVSQPRRLRVTWRDRAQRELKEKPWREKYSEMFGSMFLAAIFSLLISCVAPLLLANQPESERIATFLWLAVVGTLGSWAVIVPTKFAEGKLEDQVPMRLAQLALGTVVGLLAWGIGDILLMHSPGWHEPVDVGRGLLSHEMLRWPGSTESGNPPLPIYLAYFAFLFLVPRWWRQAEFTRESRLSLWSVIVMVGWAWLLHIFWHFPQPLGMMLAGVVALSTQLASPWMPPSRRRALAAEIEGGVA